MLVLFAVLAGSIDWAAEPFTSKCDGTFNINGRLFDFTNATFGKGQASDRIGGETLELYYTLFEPMNKRDFGLSVDEDMSVSMVVCERGRDDCKTTVYLYNWEYRSINGNVLMTSRSEVFSWNDRNYVQNSTIEMRCSEAGERVVGTQLSEDMDGRAHILDFYMTVETPFACSHVKDIAPGSGVFDHGVFETRNIGREATEDGSWIMRVNLTSLNRGLVGYYSKDRHVYWQPGEYVRCPPSKKCAGSGNVLFCSSNDICFSSLKTSRNQMAATFKDNEDPVLHIEYSDSWGSTARTEIECDDKLPMNYLVFDDLKRESLNDVRIKAKSRDVCPVWKNYPVTNCVTDDGFDFAKITGGVEEFEWGNVKVVGKPCGVTQCPSGHFCWGMEDARWWLCRSGVCTGFGNPDYFATVYERINEDKIDAKHYGVNDLKMTITYMCDETVSGLKLTGGIQTDSSGLETNVALRLKYPGTCRHPVDPTPSVEPTPVPEEFIPQVPADTGEPKIRNVLESEFIYSSGNYYQALDLSKVADAVQKGIVAQNAANQTASVYVKVSLWELVEAPAGFGFPSGYSQANIWTCWALKSGTKYCHPTGNVNFGISGEEVYEELVLHYRGLYNTSTTMFIECDEHVPEHQLQLEDRMKYDDGNKSWTEFVLHAKMSDVCRKRLAEPEIPEAPIEPTATPDPAATPILTFTRPLENDTRVDVDLARLSGIDSKDMFVERSDGEMEMATVIGDMSNILSCPEGYDCGGYETANFWKCSNGMCFPASDLRYGMSMGTTRLNEVPETPSGLGLVVDYSGGLGGYSVSVRMFCDTSRGFKIASKATLEDTRLTLTAYTAEMCPKTDGGVAISFTPGIPSSKPKLSASVIALIVIGAMAVGGLMIFLVIYFAQRKIDAKDFVRDSSCTISDSREEGSDSGEKSNAENI